MTPLQVEQELLAWQQETGRALPRLPLSIARVEVDCLVDFDNGDLELLVDDWVVFTQIWRRECERTFCGVNYNRLAVALEKADTGRVIGQAKQWDKYLDVARVLLEGR